METEDSRQRKTAELWVMGFEYVGLVGCASDQRNVESLNFGTYPELGVGPFRTGGRTSTEIHSEYFVTPEFDVTATRTCAVPAENVPAGTTTRLSVPASISWTVSLPCFHCNFAEIMEIALIVNALFETLQENC